MPEKRDLERKRLYMKAYYVRNREKLLARQAETDAKRIEEKRAYNRARHRRLGEPELARKREYYAENLENRQEKQRNYYRANKEAHIRRHFARKRRISAGFGLTTPGEQVEIDGFYLFSDCFPWFEVDHILPLRAKNLSGLHVLGNMQVLEKAANRRKFNRTCPAYIELLETQHN